MFTKGNTVIDMIIKEEGDYILIKIGWLYTNKEINLKVTRNRILYSGNTNYIAQSRLIVFFTKIGKKYSLSIGFIECQLDSQLVGVLFSDSVDIDNITKNGQQLLRVKTRVLSPLELAHVPVIAELKAYHNLKNHSLKGSSIRSFKQRRFNINGEQLTDDSVRNMWLFYFGVPNSPQQYTFNTMEELK